MKSIQITTAFLLVNLALNSQVVKIGGANILGERVRFINGIPVITSPKHDSAMKYTSGVIGNSFYGPEYIGMNKVTSPTIARGNYYPIDGYKRIHTGTFRKHYVRNLGLTGEGRKDDDVNFHINRNSNDVNFLSYLKKRKDHNVVTDPYWDKNAIMVEIDVPDNQKNKFYPYHPNMPVRSMDNINAYGPFVHDFDSSHDYIEIHPAEQMWWTNTLNSGFGITEEYNCILMSDDSKIFNNSTWQKSPLPGLFAIAFTINPNKTRLRFSIEVVGSHNSAFNSADGKTHFYKYENRNLIEVKEPEGVDILNITFENVYIQKGKSDNLIDTLIKGFLVIKSAVATPGGNLFLKIRANILDKNWRYYSDANLNNQAQVKVTLDKIEVLKEDDFFGGDKEDIYGFIAASAWDPAYKIPLATIKPVESVNSGINNLMWYSLDDNNDRSFNSIINLGKNESKIFNVSRLFLVNQTGFIRIVTDLNEDDGNTDDNPTTSESEIELQELGTDPIDVIQQTGTTQDADDMLEGYFSHLPSRERYYYENIPVSSLRVHQAVKRVAKFGSEGTEIEVHFTITRVK